MILKQPVSRLIRNLLPVLILANCSCLISCSKQDDVIKKDPPATGQNLRISNYSNADKRLIYNLLSGEEKYQAWSVHLEQFMKTEELNTQQRIFVTHLIEFINPDLFSNPLTDKVNKAVSDLKYQALTLFEEERAIKLLCTLDGSENKADDNNSCNCSRTSDWCTGLSICKESACNSQNGCGLFWLYDCNGMCGY